MPPDDVIDLDRYALRVRVSLERLLYQVEHRSYSERHRKRWRDKIDRLEATLAQYGTSDEGSHDV